MSFIQWRSSYGMMIVMMVLACYRPSKARFCDEGRVILVGKVAKTDTGSEKVAWAHAISMHASRKASGSSFS